jgi:hypothetical protein
MRNTIARKTHVWDAESDRRLAEAVQKYGTESWSLGILTYISMRTVIDEPWKLLELFQRTRR